MKTSIKIEEDTYHELFELKYAWRLKSFDETIKKLLQKAKKKGVKRKDEASWTSSVW